MFDADETKQLLGLLNQTLPPNVDALVAVRTKLAASNFDLSADERAALDDILQNVQFTGKSDVILTLMQQVNSLRMRLQPAAVTDKPAASKKSTRKKPSPPEPNNGS